MNDELWNRYWSVRFRLLYAACMQSRTAVTLLQMITTAVQWRFQVVFIRRLCFYRYTQINALIFELESTSFLRILHVCVMFYQCVSIRFLAVNSHYIPLTYASSLQYSFQLRPSACKTFKSVEFLVLFRAGRVGSIFFGSVGRVGLGRVNKYGPVDNSASTSFLWSHLITLFLSNL